MPDKLTDSEIVKELERYSDVSDSDITTTCFKTRLLKEIYLFINRLQAENERLKNAYKQCAFERDAYIEIENTAIAEVKAEAYKECIEKVKEEINKHSYGVLHKTVINHKLDNLLKELVGEDK